MNSKIIDIGNGFKYKTFGGKPPKPNERCSSPIKEN